MVPEFQATHDGLAFKLNALSLLKSEKNFDLILSSTLLFLHPGLGPALAELWRNFAADG